MIQKPDDESSRVPDLAFWMRYQREAEGLSRETLAARAKVSKHLLYLWEQKGKTHKPSDQTLLAWLKGTLGEMWRWPKAVDLVNPILSDLRWALPTEVTPDEKLQVDRVLDPMALHDAAFDLYYANEAWWRVWPGLRRPTPDQHRRPNLLEYIATHPMAEEVCRNHDHRGGVMVDAFRTVAPGRISWERIKEIDSVLQGSKNYQRWSKVRATDAEINDQTLILRNPDTMQFEERKVVAVTPKYPPRRWDYLWLPLTSPS
ncbi:helix-turn-helix domain-containing protein [Nocardia arthritidis]|uniref:MmyB-like transcription regulator ligand binding domain-containing protein n=1 Tax=Nocardia arthritidis TaxID=228602 RepID=A0A6G9YLB5_9NOCA|nr:helix-turn-helix domain-containing protein [Nocardia arthritidis]QIS13867.1 hypothetical protein F5544_30110 [Nocardia arthritidis]